MKNGKILVGITHGDINGVGYEYLNYDVEHKVAHAVLPVHPKP